METFKQFVKNQQIDEGRLSKAIGSALVGLSLVGLSPNLVGKDLNQEQQITIDKNNLSKVYRAIEQAETGSFKNKWIRTTHAPKKGSTAYGPVQITASLVRDIQNRYPSFANKHKKYIEKFLKQGEQFIKYGKEPTKPGYDKRYDYGGSGDLNSQQDRIEYTKMALDMIDILLKEKKYILKDFIKRWRGKASNEDPRYFNTIINYLK